VSSKKRNKRDGRKNATKIKNWFKALFKDDMVKQDSMTASQRGYGTGKSK